MVYGLRNWLESIEKTSSRSKRSSGRNGIRVASNDKVKLQAEVSFAKRLITTNLDRFRRRMSTSPGPVREQIVENGLQQKLKNQQAAVAAMKLKILTIDLR